MPQEHAAAPHLPLPSLLPLPLAPLPLAHRPERGAGRGPRREPEILELDAVARSHTALFAGLTVRSHALPATALRVSRGEWVAVTSVGPGPLTLLRCASGLVRPDEGRVCWRDGTGREVPPPPLALVHADWSCYGCYTVRDALESAVVLRSPWLTASTSSRRVSASLRVTALAAVADRRVSTLGAVDRWRVGVAAALAGGARWLLLELPPVLEDQPMQEGPPVIVSRSSASPSGASPSIASLSASLAALGIGAIVAAARAIPFPVHRRVALADLAAPGAPLRRPPAEESVALSRVAEGEAGAWEPPSDGVASPPGAV